VGEVMHSAESLLELLRSGNGYVRLRGAERCLIESREAIQNSQVWFADVASQDDIYEGRPIFEWVSDNVDSERVMALARSVKPDAGPHRISRDVRQVLAAMSKPNARNVARAQIEEKLGWLYRNSSIFSLFPRLPHVRDWAQYAERGKGYGLVFDFTAPWPLALLDDTGLLPAFPLPINYVPAGSRPAQLLEFGPSDPRQTFKEMQGTLLTKSNFWQDQEEHRLFRVGIPNGYVSFPPESLAAVVLGYDVDREKEDYILDLCSARTMPVSLFRMTQTRTYELDLVRIWP
jgi:hypothetical protein